MAGDMECINTEHAKEYHTGCFGTEIHMTHCLLYELLDDCIDMELIIFSINIII